MISNLLTLSLLSLLPAFAAADCATFTPDTEYGSVVYTEPANNTIPISDGHTCTGPKKCWYGNPTGVNLTEYNVIDTMVGGLLTDNRTITVGGSQDTLNSLYTLIAKAGNLTMVASATTNLTGGFGFGAQVNSSGYVGFTATHNCIRGAVSDCSGQGFPSDGTFVEACFPKTQPTSQCTTTGGYSCVAGTVSWVTTDAQTANATKCATCALEEAATSIAAIKGGNTASVLAMVGLAAAFLV